MPYSDARKLTKGLRGEKQAHHIIEKRLLQKWGYTPDQLNRAPSIVLDKQQHQKITNQLRRALPYKVRHEPEDAWKAYQEVYKDHPEWLEAIKPYFE